MTAPAASGDPAAASFALPPVEVGWLGRVPYAEALRLQEEAVASRRAGRGRDRLLLLEHPPVVTLGRSARAEHLRAEPAELARLGVELFEARRGGDVTYHAPGQLVGYLVVDLSAPGRRDVHRFLRGVEAALVRAVGSLGVRACTRAGMTGVFVDAPGPPRKIASIGIGLRGWVSWHGFALNVSMELSGFGLIVPCGLHHVQMSSLARELAGGETPAAEDPRRADLDRRARAAVAEAFSGR